jgi:hypothetical protein
VHSNQCATQSCFRFTCLYLHQQLHLQLGPQAAVLARTTPSLPHLQLASVCVAHRHTIGSHPYIAQDTLSLTRVFFILSTANECSSRQQRSIKNLHLQSLSSSHAHQSRQPCHPRPIQLAAYLLQSMDLSARRRRCPAESPLSCWGAERGMSSVGSPSGNESST